MSAFRGRGAVPPKNYVPGLGRGAAGFTTRSDVGPVVPEDAATGSGSRAAEARKQLQFGAAPANYVAGAGRGAGTLNAQGEVGPVGAYDSFSGYSAAPQEGQYDDDDDEADKIWATIDERMNRKRRKKGDNTQDDDDDAGGRKRARARIGAQFHELKEKLSEVTEDQWASIPDVGDHSLKYKQQRRQQDTFTPLSDSLIEQRNKSQLDASAGNAGLAGTTIADDGSGFKSVVADMSGLSAARGTVLGISLDRMSSSVAGNQTSIDPKGYLTSLSGIQSVSNAEVADINKARLLLKSVRDTNPKHGPGWIAAARVEEAAGKMLQARKIIQEACEICADNEDVWLEAARLHPHDVAKSILATAVRRVPRSVKIFLKAADLEHIESNKKAVLRKGLEANPSSITLWKAAIALEDAEDARLLLQVAVEKVRHSGEMWLALARLESYKNAQRVLNSARKALPNDRSIWIAAARLEESQNHDEVIDKIIQRAVKSLEKNEAVVTRAQWLQEAEAAESSGAPLTSAAIIKYTIGKDVDDEDRQRTWTEDAKGAAARGSIATARAILSHALHEFPSKRTLWTQAIDLERNHGTAKTLDEVLEAASERLPQVEIFWLLRAKEQWVNGDVNKARDILAKAFAVNPESEAVWLAASKLEHENGEVERARFFLERARQRAPTARVYMKAALLEREQKNFDEALQLIEEGLSKFVKFSKLYMMGGQICSENLPRNKNSLSRARKFYERGLKECPESHALWILASRLEEEAVHFEDVATNSQGSSATKARSILELARLKNPKNPHLWLESVKLERRVGTTKLAETRMAKALQECPKSGILLAESILSSPRVEQKSKAAEAIKRCPDDPLVIAAVASLFASENKNDKARKWFDRATVLNPDIGDIWARFYLFELKAGTQEQQEKVKAACIAAEPKHGDIWATIMKDMKNRGKSVAEGLELVAEHILLEQKKALVP
jgi:pre-mRNA-processing factor 6